MENTSSPPIHNVAYEIIQTYKTKSNVIVKKRGRYPLTLLRLENFEQNQKKYDGRNKSSMFFTRYLHKHFHKLSNPCHRLANKEVGKVQTVSQISLRVPKITSFCITKSDGVSSDTYSLPSHPLFCSHLVLQLKNLLSTIN